MHSGCRCACGFGISRNQEASEARSPPTTSGGGGGRSICTGRQTRTLRVPGQSSGQGQGFGKANPEPGFGTGVGVVADSDEPQDAGELFLHCLVLDRDQSLLMGTCKPRGYSAGFRSSTHSGLGPVPSPGVINNPPPTKHPWHIFTHTERYSCAHTLGYAETHRSSSVLHPWPLVRERWHPEARPPTLLWQGQDLAYLERG